MTLSAFGDKTKQPGPSELVETLGRASALWDALEAHAASEYGATTEEWGFPAAKYGWSLRLKAGKRTVVYMTPCQKHFVAGLVLGERAVRAARESGVSAATLDVMNSARKYAEGTGLRIEVRYKRDLDDVQKLLACKMAR